MPAWRGAFPFGIAFVLSLLLHGALLTAINLDLALLGALPEAPPIEARLAEAAKPPVPAPRPRPPRPAPPQRPVVEPAPEPAPQAEREEAAAPEPEAETAAVTGPPLGDAAATDAPTAPDAVPEPAVPAVPLNPLPPRIDLVYELRFGPARGEQTVRWVSGDGQYTLTSVASATGLSRMLYSGLLMQTSQGRISASGLQPEAFWDQRGRKRSSGRFDHAHRTLTVSREGSIQTLDLPDDVQDTQSLPFQFALTAPRIGPGPLHVFDGRKLRPYVFDNRGEVMLDTPVGTLRTLHFERKDAPADRRFEVWLAVDLHYLPVRVLRPDDSGADGELLIRSIAYPR